MPKTILVIDDDLTVLKSLERLFKKEGYEIACVSSGKAALELIENRDFDLVVADIRMPDLDGVETVRMIKEMRAKQSKPNIPVVFITGYSDMVAIDKAKQYGEVVLKPFDLEEFLNRVKQQSAKRRVVITGLGVVAPNGIGKDEFWEANVKGKSGVNRIEDFDTTSFNSKIAAQIKNFDPLKYMSVPVVSKTDRFSQLGIVAAKLAIEDSKLDLEKEDKSRIGVSVGTGLGGMSYHEVVVLEMYENKFTQVDPLSVPKVTSNAVSGNISIIFNLIGPNMTLSTACSSGANAIGYACDLIRLGRADVMVSGGAEAPVTPFTLRTFDALKVLSRRNDSPCEASRPFDKERDGFVMGEGAGVVILEELNHALQRKAHIYAEMIGYGANSGAYHMVMPKPGGQDITEVMIQALKDAGVKPKDVNYINAHGTSTQANDKAETQAIKQVFGEYAHKIPISSTKSMIGHTIGAAGAIEAIICALSIENNLIPPTINYRVPDPDCDLDYVPNEARKAKVNIALSNSFGFGSNNACLVMRRYKSE